MKKFMGILVITGMAVSLGIFGYVKAASVQPPIDSLSKYASDTSTSTTIVSTVIPMSVQPPTD